MWMKLCYKEKKTIVTDSKFAMVDHKIALTNCHLSAKNSQSRTRLDSDIKTLILK